MTQLCLDAPLITKYKPALGGVDNEGIGSTRYGEDYLLKADPNVAVAEFVGASLCKSIGIPTPEPFVVLFNEKRVFGSRIEGGIKSWVQDDDLINLLKSCDNVQALSAVLAVDVAIGNNDRHWNNWLYQERQGGAISLRAIDFSRSWPTTHPPRSPNDMLESNTHLAWRAWSYVGVTFDQNLAKDTLKDMEKLDINWLSSILDPLPVEWYKSHSSPDLKNWWHENWTQKVKDTKLFISEGAWGKQ